jgi:glycosyltransferase involved in cell wall biosynthesis
VKGSELIDPILRRLDDEGVISYRPIERVSFDEMVALYQGADIVLDQFRLADYGVAACEAMAAGRVVVAHVSDSARSMVREQTGLELPIVESTVEELESVLRDILDNRDRYRAIAADGVSFTREVHDGRASARALAPYLAPGS